MNILLIYGKYPKFPLLYGKCFEKSLRKKYNVKTFDLIQSPYYIRRGPIGVSFTLGKFNLYIPFTGFYFKKKAISILSVIKKCKRQPDLIIEIESGGYHHLEGYKYVDIPKVCWVIDSHVISKLKFQKEIISDFNYTFVAQKDYIPLFKKIVDNVFWLPLAADPEINKKYDTPKIFDIGFVGSKNPKMYPDRIKILNKLSEKHDVLSVWGIWGENISKIYGISRIGFNKSLSGDLNMRVFEVMSCGSMLLTDKIGNGITDLFKDKKHLVVYSTEEELYELIQYYLENEDEREKIAKEGQIEVLKNHTYDNRVEYMLDKIKL